MVSKQLKILWQNQDLEGYKVLLKRTHSDSSGEMVSFLKSALNKSLDKKGLEFYKHTLDWMRKNNLRHTGSWGNEEIDIITKKSKPQFKEKNKHYLNVLSLYAENKYILYLPWIFSKYWPEGWKEFDPHIQNSKRKTSYLISSFILANPTIRQDIDILYSQEQIKAIISSDKNRGKNQFWGSLVEKNITGQLDDEHILQMLQWAKSRGVGVQPEHRVKMYLTMKYPQTIGFLVKELGVENLQNQLVEKHPLTEKRKEEINELNAYLLALKLENNLLHTHSTAKKIKI